MLASIIAILFICTAAGLVYYLGVLGVFITGGYSEKKEFWLDLIPFRLWIKSVTNTYKDLK